MTLRRHHDDREIRSRRAPNRVLELAVEEARRWGQLLGTNTVLALSVKEACGKLLLDWGGSQRVREEPSSCWGAAAPTARAR